MVHVKYVWNSLEGKTSNDIHEKNMGDDTLKSYTNGWTVGHSVPILHHRIEDCYWRRQSLIGMVVNKACKSIDREEFMYIITAEKQSTVH